MLNENAKQWVAALRSGEYEQGYHRLRDRNNKYCVLGVPCELYHIATGQLTGKLNGQGDYVYGDRTAELPLMVCEWLGLESCNGYYDASSVSIDNDKGMSFPDLADLIESEPSGLFVDAD